MTTETQPNDPYLRVQRLSKAFNGTQVLREINLDCHAGELICLLGPSGCGKTTLLRMIAGLEQQDQGQVWQAGEDISARPAEKRDFGIVFQSYALFPNLTVAQNIGYGLRKFSKNAIRERVSELLAMVDLTAHTKKYPAQLSGGQQQRVALARALAISPGLLLLDEPLSALDAKVREHLRHEIKSLQRKLGITTIMVTHDQDEAMSMADRIVVMNQGVIEQVGSPYEIYQRPVSPFVANFIGTMNFMPAVRYAGDVIQTCETEICCSVPEWVPSGEPLKLGVRPEHVHAEPLLETAVESVPQRLRGEIEEMEFLGPCLRLHIRLSGDKHKLLVDVLGDEQRKHSYSPKMRVQLGLKDNALSFYANERQAS